MDYVERLAKLEAVVNAHRGQFGRIEQELMRVHDSIASLREHTDRGLAELREHTDRGLAELREHTDKGFAEQRKESLKTTRWLIGLALAYGSAIVGIAARMAGLV
jgi:hypothetical protein